MMPHSDHDGPLAKRSKVGPVAKAKIRSRPGSTIFAPFRTVGLVSPTSVPFTCVPRGKTTFQITTSVGRSLQTYDLKRGLNLVFVTRPQTPEAITATHAWNEKVFAAWGGGRDDGAQGLWVFQRGKKAAEVEIPNDLDQPITQILVFGSWVVGCAKTRIEVWKLTNLEHYTTLHIIATKNGDNELTGGVCNMPTYLNKIFVGRQNGWVEIWNVSTGKLIYTILPPAADCGAVACLEPTTALSLLAISYSKGPLIIHDILLDKTLIRLDAGIDDAPVTTMSLRSDGRGAGKDGRSDGVLATATKANGDVTFWDLNQGGRIMGVLRSAHNPPSHEDGSIVGGGISKVEFLSGQAVILTSGRDNSLKSWIFDETPFSPVPRILHTRSGHAGPVNSLQFLPSDFDGADAGNKWLLSGGQDRSLWGWSLRRDGQSSELSQGNIRKKATKFGMLGSATLSHGPTTTLNDLKAPEIISIACSLNRDGGIGALPGNQPMWQKGHVKPNASNAEISGSTGWESVVTAHKNDSWARTWFWGRKRAGRWAFQTGDGSDVSTVAISTCGTFAIVGSQNGSIDMFNLQSGLHRRRFPSKLTPAQARQLKMQHQRQLDDLGQIQERVKDVFSPGTGKHVGPVTGIAVDSLNKLVISCSLDGTVKFWDFLTGNLLHEIDWALHTAITGIRYHAPSDLVAFSCDDYSIRVVDIETKNLIREFRGSQGGFSDYCFSNDGRWIIAASQDSLVRVWDLPTSHLVDAFRLERPCKALAFSATGEYLAAAIEGELGVQIWTNTTLFKHVSTKQISESDIATISEPTTSGEGGQGLLEGAFDDEEANEDDDGVAAPTVDQISSEMMTLSLVPKSRWQTLLHLDLIKQRNKPKEPPKAPEKAPFFLPLVGEPQDRRGLKDSASVPEGEKTTEPDSRITKFERSRAEEAFTTILREGAASQTYDGFIEHLKSLSPSTADLELRSLSLGLGSEASHNELLHFIRALTSRLVARRDYELVQAWMTVFLRLHFETIMENALCLDALRTWREHHAREKERLDNLVGYCGGVLGFLRNPRT